MTPDRDTATTPDTPAGEDAVSGPASGVRVEVVTTNELSPDTTAAIRSLLDLAFDEDFSDDDWQHSLGGRHVLVHVGGRLVAHAAVVRRDVWVGGAEVEARYVEAVATEPDVRGTGLGSIAMRAIGELVGRDGALGILSTGAHAFYERLGWRRWQGPSWVVGPDGTRTRTPDEDDGIMVLGLVDDVSASIACRSRAGDDW